MKTIRALCLSAALVLSHSAYAQATKICYEDADNIPWNVAGGKGLNNELVRLASEHSGVPIELLPLPWKRCLLYVADGRVAGALGASYTDERASYAVYPTRADGKLDVTRRIRFDGYTLYRRKGTEVSWDGKSFTNLVGPVGVQLGYAISGDLRKLGVTTQESGGGAQSQLRMLIKGQVAVVALLTNEGDALLLDPEFSSEVERIQPAFSQKPYFVIFNKQYYVDHKKLVDDLWAAIASVRESAAFKQLVSEKVRK